ncbi:SpaH/EbpB family LPXTG-anchored major pilin [Corynebacterium auris]|uniref:SpaH/EbpB family LPXTG-anchored major pilin n=1 Tax=Corynebacterium auris TaxID=44750 RepID=UPI0025B609BE|nr:SpaH/EbpB family LPXTG-anchored major pilin [Corynebacterium auris]WJY67032.1 hypothetical protein CAURIS_00420 [Corynebacterium auris]
MNKTKIAVLLVAGALAFAPGAEARTVTGKTDNVAVEAIDSTRSVDLTITKSPRNPYDDPPPNMLPDGGLAGFTFELRRVEGVDLTTASGWEKARAMSLDEARQAANGPRYTATTDSTGTARFTDLPIGLYYVVETPPDRPGYTWFYGGPFLITLPIGDATETQWLYDVTIRAKSPLPGTPPTTTPPTATPPPATPPTMTPPTSTPPTTTPPQPPSTMPGPGPTPAPGDTPTPGAPVPGEGQPGDVPRLASTGANVVTIALLGLAMVLLGIVLARRRRSER